MQANTGLLKEIQPCLLGKHLPPERLSPNAAQSQATSPSCPHSAPYPPCSQKAPQTSALEPLLALEAPGSPPTCHFSRKA